MGRKNPVCAKAELRNPVIHTARATWMPLTTGAQALPQRGPNAPQTRRKRGNRKAQRAQRAYGLRSLRAATAMRAAAPGTVWAFSQQRQEQFTNEMS